MIVAGEADGQTAVTPPALPVIRLVGAPGQFLTWGHDLVCQILAQAGYSADVETFEHAAVLPAAPGRVRVLLAHGPVLIRDDFAPPEGMLTLAFLDEPEVMLHELTLAYVDPVSAARTLTGLLAPLYPVLRQPGSWLVLRAAAESPSAVRAQLQALLLPHAPPAPVPADSAIVLPRDAPPQPSVSMLLTRQILRPMFRQVIGGTAETMVLPLACFYAGDHPGEQATPLVDAAGPARVLYYGPYYYLLPGRWRLEAECYFSQDLGDSLLAVDVFTDVVLARAEFQPPAEGFYKVTFPLTVPQAQDRAEVRFWLLRGAIQGQAGLRQVILTPDEDGDAAVGAIGLLGTKQE
jgi:hypothetical protein